LSNFWGSLHTVNGNKYCFGFQGHEKDNEVTFYFKKKYAKMEYKKFKKVVNKIKGS